MPRDKIGLARPMSRTAPSIDTVWTKLLAVEQRLNALVSAQSSRVWRVTQQANFVSTTQLAITWEGGQGWDGTAIPVVSGIYIVRGTLNAAMGSPNQNQFARFTGPSIANMSIGYQCVQGTTVYSSGICTAINQDMTINMVASTQGEFNFQGVVQFNASGDLNMAGRLSSTTPWAVMGGSYLEANLMRAS